MKLNYITKIIFFSIPIVFIFWAFYNFFAMDGYMKAEYDFGNQNAFVRNLYPKIRLNNIDYADGKFFQEMILNPVYFDVKVPVNFKKALVTINYKKQNQPVIELGGATDYYGKSYLLKPVDNDIINNLFENTDWYALQDEDVILFQKNNAKRYLSIQEFLAEFDYSSKVALYNFPINKDFEIKNYQPKNEYWEINNSMRGYHQFYTYIKEEALDYVFTFQDINRHKGDDPVEIQVYYKDELIKTFELADDGKTSNYDPASEQRDLQVFVPDLTEGVYKIIINTNDDIFIRKIKTKQQYLSFINNIYLTDNAEYKDGFPELKTDPTTVYTNGDMIYAQTAHVNGLQTVKVGNNDLQVLERGEQYLLKDFEKTNGSIVEVKSPKNDLRLTSNTVFSFTKESFFDPEFISLRNRTSYDFDAQGIEYVLTKYLQPTQQGDWQTNTIEFNLDKFYYFKGNTLKFVLSMPEIENNQGIVTIENIKVELFREPFSLEVLKRQIGRLLTTNH